MSTEARLKTKGRLLGDMLVGLGILSSKQKEQILKLQQRELYKLRAASSNAKIPYRLLVGQIAIKCGYTSKAAIEIVAALQAVDRKELLYGALVDSGFNISKIDDYKEIDPANFDINSLPEENWIKKSPNPTKSFQALNSLFKFLIYSIMDTKSYFICHAPDFIFAKRAMQKLILAEKLILIRKFREVNLEQVAKILLDEVVATKKPSYTEIEEAIFDIINAVNYTISRLTKAKRISSHQQTKLLQWVQARKDYIDMDTFTNFKPVDKPVLMQYKNKNSYNSSSDCYHQDALDNVAPQKNTMEIREEMFFGVRAIPAAKLAKRGVVLL